MKRKHGGQDGPAECPSLKRRAEKEHFRESESVRERAKPYLLAVAKLHSDVLETTWSRGRNRRVEPTHVRQLKETFMRGGLERCAPENRMFVLCSAKEVRQVLEAQKEDEDEDAGEDPSANGDSHGSNEHLDDTSFLNWSVINKTRVEVMAGQHRLRALREYIEATGAPETDSWWVCELYDKDRLPAELNIKLRVNRRDPNLPDNHGQIWTQLVSVASEPNGTASVDQGTVDHKLVEALRLGGEKSFPTRRLVTLWNHERWRAITTRWCQTRLGLETFNISTFEWMASLRIDDYWFATLEAVLNTLDALPLDATQDMGRDDWNRLVVALDGRNTDAAPRAREAVEAVFYTGSNADGPHRRAAGLLDTLDNETYRKTCRAIWAETELVFVDLKRLLRSKRPETESAVRVLQHVIGWVHQAGVVELKNVNPKSKKKPQLRDHLQTALDRLSASRSAAGEYPEGTARQLQQRVLDFTRHHAGAFRDREAQALVASDITLVDDPAYGRRFNHAAWARLLRIVRQVTDTGDQDDRVLRPSWRAVTATEEGVRREQVSTLVTTFCTTLLGLGSRPIKKNDPSFLSLQQGMERFLTSSTTELRGILTFAPFSSSNPDTPHNSDAGDSYINEDEDEYEFDKDNTSGRPHQTQQQQPSDSDPPPSAQRSGRSHQSSKGKAPHTRAESPKLPPNSDEASYPPPRHQTTDIREQRSRATSLTSRPPKSIPFSSGKPMPHWKTGPRAGRR
ncbi:hypothetical protein CABS01_16568 [Colletotrichum abscissum]|uniref:uncharacterized protein n=1 Tax=Colletotrichum abscissum TaxID=1671311 RepID=UPI0027D54F19|nr:uncharacterized protein CABS01_16568 [Colletotrichum abscissum]KAK1519800.1 hypothetical protein CABS01_16568 [Colletotrichum abscissum]